MNFGDVLTRYYEVASHGQYRGDTFRCCLWNRFEFKARRGGGKFDKDAVAT